MGWNGTGTCSLTDGVHTSNWANGWANDGDAKIKSTDHDLLLQDVEDSIQACLAKNGENALTGNLKGGGFRLTNITASANTDAATFGKAIASGAYSSPNINLTTNDGSTIAIDVSAIEAGTGGVDTTTAQTVGGIKTFSAIGSHAHAKFNGPTTSKVLVPTPGANVTVDTTAGNAHYVSVGTATGIAFTWPTGASDSQLGDNWTVTGKVLCRLTGAYAITLDSTMLAALDDYEVEGAPVDASGEMCSLVYNYFYLNGTEYAQFAWVSTPS